MRVWLEEEKKTTTASEDFKRNLEDGMRYVDKTKLLIPLLNREHETTFLLRPRRFGKTLTLSMIRCFVEGTRNEALNEENRELFRGLKIMEAGETYKSQLLREGYRTVKTYSLAFCEKRCRVIQGETIRESVR